jgi:hypothetical protein
VMECSTDSESCFESSPPRWSRQSHTIEKNKRCLKPRAVHTPSPALSHGDSRRTLHQQTHTLTLATLNTASNSCTPSPAA